MPRGVKTEYWCLSFVSIGTICMYHRFMIVYCAYLDNEFGLYCNFRPSVAGHETSRLWCRVSLFVRKSMGFHLDNFNVDESDQ